MKTYKAEITITIKNGVLDTQGKAVENNLKAHGHQSTSEVRVGRFVSLCLQAKDEAAARAEVENMCDNVLVNDLIESYQLIIELDSEGPRY